MHAIEQEGNFLQGTQESIVDTSGKKKMVFTCEFFVQITYALVRIFKDWSAFASLDALLARASMSAFHLSSCSLLSFLRASSCSLR